MREERRAENLLRINSATLALVASFLINMLILCAPRRGRRNYEPAGPPFTILSRGSRVTRYTIDQGSMPEKRAPEVCPVGLDFGVSRRNPRFVASRRMRSKGNEGGEEEAEVPGFYRDCMMLMSA